MSFELYGGADPCSSNSCNSAVAGNPFKNPHYTLVPFLPSKPHCPSYILASLHALLNNYKKDTLVMNV